MTMVISLLAEENRKHFKSLALSKNEVMVLLNQRDELILQKKYDYSPLKILEHSQKYLKMKEPKREDIIWLDVIK